MDWKLMISMGCIIGGIAIVIAFTQGAAFVGINR